MIVGVIGFAFIGKFRCRKQIIVLRKMVINGASGFYNTAGGAVFYLPHIVADDHPGTGLRMRGGDPFRRCFDSKISYYAAMIQ